MQSSSLSVGPVCLVPLSNNVSGTERVLADIAKTLHANGCSPFLMVPDSEKFSQFVGSLGSAPRATSKIGPVAGKAAIGRNFLPAFRAFSSWKPRIVHFHCPHYRWGLDVILAARLARVPTIIRTEHNPLMSAPGRLANQFLRLADSLVSTFTYVSNGNQERYERLLPYRRGRGRVIFNGIDPTRFMPNGSAQARHALRAELGFPEDAAIAVHIGAHDERRSLLPIFKALQLLRDNPATSEAAKRWRLVVIGDRPDKEHQLARELQVADVTVFAGRRSDVNTLLPLCDLFVTASHYEGMSIAILEAWACGLPILTTKVDGITDVIGERAGATFTVPHGDSEAFARVWLQFMLEPGRMSVPHKEATARVRSAFTTHNMLAGYLELYQEQKQQR